jgi:hypothetical protein
MRVGAYGAVLAMKEAGERRAVEGTLAGPRFVRNQMGYSSSWPSSSPQLAPAREQAGEHVTLSPLGAAVAAHRGSNPAPGSRTDPLSFILGVVLVSGPLASGLAAGPLAICVLGVLVVTSGYSSARSRSRYWPCCAVSPSRPRNARSQAAWSPRVCLVRFVPSQVKCY